MFWKRRESRENDLERELHSHLELEVQEQHEQGMSKEEARCAAQLGFRQYNFYKRRCAKCGAGLSSAN